MELIEPTFILLVAAVYGSHYFVFSLEVYIFVKLTVAI